MREVNSSIYVFRADRLWPVLDRLTPHNAQGELYLTDSVGILVTDGERVAVHKGGSPVETEGIEIIVSITMLLQNASIFRRPLTSYFNQRGRVEAIRFQTTPPGKGTVSDESIVDNDYVTIGPVLFKSPEGNWKAGTHRFAIENDVAKAALPIRLE